MAKHIHAELIHAWADGAEIEFKNDEDKWIDIDPTWNVNREYRIKPRIVKREGRVNIYPTESILEGFIASSGHVFSSFKRAVEVDDKPKRLATVIIEWEEEE